VKAIMSMVFIPGKTPGPEMGLGAMPLPFTCSHLVLVVDPDLFQDLHHAGCVDFIADDERHFHGPVPFRKIGSVSPRGRHRGVTFPPKRTGSSRRIQPNAPRSEKSSMSE